MSVNMLCTHSSNTYILVIMSSPVYGTILQSFKDEQKLEISLCRGVCVSVCVSAVGVASLWNVLLLAASFLFQSMCEYFYILTPVMLELCLVWSAHMFFGHVFIFIFLQVQRVLNNLYENKKIASATHNIYAYRYFCF